MDECQLREFAAQMPEGYARETLIAVLEDPEIDSSSFVLDSVFRSMIIDSGYGVTAARAVYNGLVTVTDTRLEHAPKAPKALKSAN